MVEPHHNEDSDLAYDRYRGKECFKQHEKCLRVTDFAMLPCGVAP